MSTQYISWDTSTPAKWVNTTISSPPTQAVKSTLGGSWSSFAGSSFTTSASTNDYITANESANYVIFGLSDGSSSNGVGRYKVGVMWDDGYCKAIINGSFAGIQTAGNPLTDTVKIEFTATGTTFYHNGSSFGSDTTTMTGLTGYYVAFSSSSSPATLDQTEIITTLDQGAPAGGSSVTIPPPIAMVRF